MRENREVRARPPSMLFTAGRGHAVRLLGMNRSGPEYACQQGWGLFDGPMGSASIAVMKSWQINSVRVALNETCWLGSTASIPSSAAPPTSGQFAAMSTGSRRRGFT